jgi:hypothetical protein
MVDLMQTFLRTIAPQAAAARMARHGSHPSSRFKLLRLVVVTFVLFAFSLTARAEINVPQPQGMVSDFAGKLTPETKSNLEALLMNFRDRSGGIEDEQKRSVIDALGDLLE